MAHSCDVVRTDRAFAPGAERHDELRPLLDESIADMRSWLEWHRGIAPRCLNLRFHELDRHPLLTILRIQRWLLGACVRAEAEEIERRYARAAVKERFDALEPDAGVVEWLAVAGVLGAAKGRVPVQSQ